MDDLPPPPPYEAVATNTTHVDQQGSETSTEEEEVPIIVEDHGWLIRQTETMRPTEMRPTQVHHPTQQHPTRQLDPTKMHPLMAAAYRNKTESPLCRLPDRVLVRLMQVSDRVTVECLRRASRTFLRLFPTACRDNQGPPERRTDCGDDDDDHIVAEGFPWPVSAYIRDKKSTRLEARQLCLLLERDAYCKTCLAARSGAGGGRQIWNDKIKRLVRTYLHCSGCNADHPACLFSSRQRSRHRRGGPTNENGDGGDKKEEEEEGATTTVTSTTMERLCIGQEGFARLCKHFTISWPWLVSEVNRRLRSTDTALALKDLHACHEDDHRPACETQTSQKDLVETMGAMLASTPRLSINKHGSKPTLSLNFKWWGHAPLNWKEARSHGGRGIQARDLESAIETVYEEQGRFICPPTGPPGRDDVRGRGFGLCDPGRCDCIEYAGKSETADDDGSSWTWPRPNIEWREFNTCRVQPDTRGFDSPTSMGTHPLGYSSVDEMRAQCWYHVLHGNREQQFVTISECEVHPLGGPRRGGSSCVVFMFLSKLHFELSQEDQDGTNTSTLITNQPSNNNTPLLRHMSNEWYYALDPDSFGLTEDADGLGVYWCWDKGCRNYYRYGTSRLRGLLRRPSDYVRECPAPGL